jgi:peptidoglycan/xylan/chitin deacetylase (PgdA/CDA1 family)
MRTFVRYKIENPSPLKQYIFDFLFNITGIRGVKANLGSEQNQLDIYYGNNPSEDCKIVILEKVTDTIWRQLIEGKISENDINRTVKFDIVNAISCFITDEVNENLSDDAYDNHERLIFSRSFQSRANIANIPIVNSYVNFFRVLLESKLSIKGIPLWPQGKKCAIGLSHDVDIPDKYAILKSPLFCKNKDFKWHLVTNLKKAKAITEYVTGKDPNDYWLFEDIIREEEKYGFKSTFFFTSVNQFDERGTVFDVAYDIDSQKFIEVFRNIKERGFEIGLHASYNAYLSEDYLAFEKARLEKIAGVKVVGLRHHRWHLGKDPLRTLKMHEQAGFEYDSSIAFNDDEMGFRRNIALPYHPWDPIKQSMINVFQLPIFCMDGNLLFIPTEVCEAIRKLKDYIGTIKQTGGLGVIDWHDRASFPKNSGYLNWGKTYIKLLEFLSGDNDIWITNLGDINSWLRERNKLIPKLVPSAAEGLDVQ